MLEQGLNKDSTVNSSEDILADCSLGNNQKIFYDSEMIPRVLSTYLVVQGINFMGKVISASSYQQISRVGYSLERRTTTNSDQAQCCVNIKTRVLSF